MTFHLRADGASEKPLRLAGFFTLLAVLDHYFFRLPFDIAKHFAVPLLLGTVFADEHIRVRMVEAWRLELLKVGSVPVA